MKKRALHRYFFFRYIYMTNFMDRKEKKTSIKSTEIDKCKQKINLNILVITRGVVL